MTPLLPVGEKVVTGSRDILDEFALAEAHAVKAEILMANARQDDAGSSVEIALRLDPDNRNMRFNIACALVASEHRATLMRQKMASCDPVSRTDKKTL